jgi:hypothetical protein
MCPDNMETSFYISLNIKTATGFETFAKFYVGCDWKSSQTIFSMLKGEDDVSEKSILYMDFIEIQNEVPFTVGVLHCTLEELAENTKIITRELFKQFNLKSSKL